MSSLRRLFVFLAWTQATAFMVPTTPRAGLIRPQMVAVSVYDASREVSTRMFLSHALCLVCVCACVSRTPLLF